MLLASSCDQKPTTSVSTRSLAEQGVAGAQYDLGYAYFTGEGVAQNYAEAINWFRLAAEQGDGDAQNDLGFMYLNGEGVPENYLAAYVWLSVSAAQGNHLATDNIDIVKNALTKEQLAQGQALAATCFESEYKDCP